MKTALNNRYQEIRALLANIEFEVDSDGVGVEYEDSNFYLSCNESVDNPEFDYINVCIKTRPAKINAETFEEFKVDLTTEEYELILSHLQDLQANYLSELENEEKQNVEQPYDEYWDAYRHILSN